MNLAQCPVSRMCLSGTVNSLNSVKTFRETPIISDNFSVISPRIVLFSLQRLDSCYVILTSVIAKSKATLRHWVDVIALQKSL